MPRIHLASFFCIRTITNPLLGTIQLTDTPMKTRPRSIRRYFPGTYINANGAVVSPEACVTDAAVVAVVATGPCIQVASAVRAAAVGDVAAGFGSEGWEKEE